MTKMTTTVRGAFFGLVAMGGLIFFLLKCRPDNDSARQNSSSEPSHRGDRSLVSSLDNKSATEDLRTIIRSGIHLTTSPELSSFVEKSEDPLRALIAAHMLSDAPEYWLKLVQLHKEHPTIETAAYLSILTKDPKEKLEYANTAISLDPQNAISYLLKANALKQAESREEYNSCMESALLCDSCDPHCMWFRDAKEEALKALGFDRSSISADRVHSIWDKSIGELLQPLTVYATTANNDSASAMIGLICNLRNQLPSDNWRVQELTVSAAELSMLRSLPDYLKYDENQTIGNRIETLSMERRRSLQRLGQASLVLQQGNLSQLRSYYLIMEDKGLDAANKWLLEP